MAQRMDGGQFDADTLQLLAVVSRFEKKARRETIKEKPTAAVETPTENPAPASGDGDGASLTCAEATHMIAITIANKKAFNMLTCAILRKFGKFFGAASKIVREVCSIGFYNLGLGKGSIL
ncbi:hypothetical protein V6N12_014755 [Hibiscus sabdariffa]|uniref:Uncharacterized protein n=1 Tax=Hibiscus sabdariffa TaxID=183260 RepID=A0ABR2DMM8_9ROSI